MLKQEMQERKMLEKQMKQMKAAMDGQVHQQYAALVERMKRTQIDLEGDFAQKLQQVNSCMLKLDHELKNLSESLPNFPTETSCIIANLHEEPNEDLYNKSCILLEKYKARCIKPKRCERIKSRDNRPGLVQMQFNTKKEKDQVLQSKSSLKHLEPPYNNIFIRSSVSTSERINRANLECLLRELPSGERFQIKQSWQNCYKKSAW